MPISVVLYVSSVDGHRGSYLKILGNLLNGKRSTSLLQMLTTSAPVFFITLEGSFFLYCVMSCLRSVFKRRTVGLLLRPKPALIGRNPRLRIKKLILTWLLRLPQVQTLTILPFYLDPNFGAIADGWIHDPQLWDLTAKERERAETTEGTLCADIRKVAAGRHICCAMGRQDKSKGFHWFAELYAKNSELRRLMLFAFGGKVNATLKPSLSAFEQAGGFACNRVVNDAELLDLYAVADLVWCVYDPGYDQASGILGRAVQLGIPVVVRRNSLAHRLCEIEGFVHLAIDPIADVGALATVPPREDSKKTAERARRMGEESLARLRAALGVSA